MTKTNDAKPGYHEWEDRHTKSMITAMISTVIASRASIYSHPGLRGQVDGHGSDRIKKKMDAVLRKLAMDYGVDGGIVQELGAGSKKRGGGGASDGGTPKKRAARQSGTPKKLKTEESGGCVKEE